MSPAKPAGPVVVVLAAGRGLRFKGDGQKLSRSLAGTTVLGRTLAQVIASGLPVVVVTTSELVPIAQEVVAARDIVLVPPVGSASREPLGMGYSTAAGVAARAHAAGWLVLPGDMPQVSPQTLRRLARELGHFPVVYAQHQGRQSGLVAFSAELFTELSLLRGDEGVRRLLVRYPSQPVEVDDPGVLIDVDTVADLERARQVEADCLPHPPAVSEAALPARPLRLG